MTNMIEPPQYLMPAKFTLVLIQVLLLALVLQQTDDHIYWGIGFNYSSTSDEQTSFFQIKTFKLYHKITQKADRKQITINIYIMVYQTAQKTLVGICIAYLFCISFEFVVMVLGMSLLYNQFNIVKYILFQYMSIFYWQFLTNLLSMIQIFLHFLGCLFTTWFILDSWRFTYIWPLWAFFGLVPFIFECCIIFGVVRMNKDISNNTNGIFRY